MKRAGVGRAGLIAIAVASLGACAGGGADAPLVSTVGMPGALEPVHAAAFTRNEAIFWVSSNGCTRKEDLIPIVTIQGGDAVITLRRLDEDTCREPDTKGQARLVDGYRRWLAWGLLIERGTWPANHVELGVGF